MPENSRTGNDPFPLADTTPSRWWPAVVAAYALAGGIGALAGWLLDIPWLTDWEGSGISQMPNNAFGVALSAVAIMLFAAGWRRIAAAAGALVAVLGLATLLQYAAGVDFGIDRLIAFREWGQRGTVVPGRMGPPGAFSLAILGSSIALLGFAHARRAAAIGAAGVMALVSLSLVGHLFGADRLYTIPKLTTIALQTSTMLFALAAALMLCLPEQQPLRTLRERSAAGLLLRTTWPALAVLTVLLGWIEVRALDEGLFDPAFGTALLVLALLAACTLALWWAAGSIRTHERRALAHRDRLVGVLESVGDAVMIVDGEWRFLFVNEALRRRSSRGDLIGRVVWDAFPEAATHAVREKLERAMAGRTGVEYEAYFESTGRWYADRAYPTADGGLAVFSRDVTERRRSEDELRRLAEDLRTADRRKDEFLATLAHELRNPLAPVRNALEIIKRGGHDAALVEQARATMERQIVHLVRLIDDLLDVSRITRDKLELRRERVELAAVVQHAVETCAPLVAESGHELGVSLPREPIPLDADPIRLAQVFGNLLTNACRYTARGGRIALVATRDGDEVAVSVKDSGIGIPAEMLARVFDMFVQGDRVLERAGGGLGIGLTLVKRLVELHGGSVSAHSGGSGQGSEFVVRLPVRAEAPAAIPRSRAGTAEASAPRRRILVVDDNADAGASLAMLLELGGHEVRVAGDGAEGLERAASFQPDLVLLDLGMPRMDGFALCRALRAEPWGATMTIIAVTGLGQAEDRRLTQEAGFDGHLVKPVDFADVLAALARAPRASPAADDQITRE